MWVYCIMFVWYSVSNMTDSLSWERRCSSVSTDRCSPEAANWNYNYSSQVQWLHVAAATSTTAPPQHHLLLLLLSPPPKASSPPSASLQHHSDLLLLLPKHHLPTLLLLLTQNQLLLLLPQQPLTSVAAAAPSQGSLAVPSVTSPQASPTATAPAAPFQSFISAPFPQAWPSRSLRASHPTVPPQAASLSALNIAPAAPHTDTAPDELRLLQYLLLLFLQRSPAATAPLSFTFLFCYLFLNFVNPSSVQSSNITSFPALQFPCSSLYTLP